MALCSRRLLAQAVLTGALLHAGPVDEYMAAFDREAQRRTAEPLRSPERQPGNQRLVSEPTVTTYEIPGVRRPGDVHHLRGRTFLPGAKIADVMSVARSYAKHDDLFGPRIAGSALCAQPAADTFVYRYWTDSFRDSVSESRAVHRQHDPARYSVSTILTGIGGTGDVRGRDRLCSGTLKGVSYLKDLRVLWIYQQVDAGVWVDSEMVAVLSGFAFMKAMARRSLKELIEDGLNGWTRRFKNFH